jgi:hypothetical protein
MKKIFFLLSILGMVLAASGMASASWFGDWVPWGTGNRPTACRNSTTCSADADCCSGFQCDIKNSACFQPCNANSCGQGQQCNATTHQCEQMPREGCAQDPDCAPNGVGWTCNTEDHLCHPPPSKCSEGYNEVPMDPTARQKIANEYAGIVEGIYACSLDFDKFKTTNPCSPNFDVIDYGSLLKYICNHSAQTSTNSGLSCLPGYTKLQDERGLVYHCPKSGLEAKDDILYKDPTACQAPAVFVKHCKNGECISPGDQSEWFVQVCGYHAVCRATGAHCDVDQNCCSGHCGETLNGTRPVEVCQ